MDRALRENLAGSEDRGESLGDGGQTWVGNDSVPRGTVVLHPEPALGDLFGSLRINCPVAPIREEKQAARGAIGPETAGKGNP
jgi:hypothetical protein